MPIVGDARLVLEQMLELLEQEEAQQPLDDIRDWWHTDRAVACPSCRLALRRPER
ncbi:hypothetical protein LNP74_00850 [Klebsiella pneumoniae subsp. pneumoniae]|nr:hypothetical protein [Klebsiella pneumoniae subsp. pneumoniae]